MQKLRTPYRSRTFPVLFLMGLTFALAFLEAGWVGEADAQPAYGWALQGGTTIPTVPEVPTATSTKKPRQKPTRTPTFVYISVSVTPTTTETRQPTETAALTAALTATLTASQTAADTAVASATNTEEPTLAPAPTSPPPAAGQGPPVFSLNMLGIVSLIAAFIGLIILIWALRRAMR